MPSLSDILSDPTLRAQTVWRFYRSLPEGDWTVEALDAYRIDVPDLAWTESEAFFGSFGDLIVFEAKVETAPAPSGAAGKATWGALLLPGGSDQVSMMRMPGGYEFYPGMRLQFTLRLFAAADGG